MGQFERRRAGNRAGLSLEEMATAAEQGRAGCPHTAVAVTCAASRLPR
jgi:hypothetical protein